ncbi:MAG: OmpA family protein, partial [Pseudomonas stutzeri]|nr:OmpA family protein [Stutzerimonas stutzeri]
SMQPFQSLQPEMVMARAEQLFAPPDSVRLEISGTTLKAAGVASSGWARQLQEGYTRLTGIEALDVSALSVTEQITLADRIRELSGKRFFFTGGVEFVPGQRESLQSHVTALQALQAEAQQAGAAMLVTLTGSTDAIGDAAANVRLAERRAAAAAALFAEAGVDAEVARLSVIPKISGEAQEDAG